jgi:hypothetical protein
MFAKRYERLTMRLTKHQDATNATVNLHSSSKARKKNTTNRIINKNETTTGHPLHGIISRKPLLNRKRCNDIPPRKSGKGIANGKTNNHINGSGTIGDEEGTDGKFRPGRMTAGE